MRVAAPIPVPPVGLLAVAAAASVHLRGVLWSLEGAWVALVAGSMVVAVSLVARSRSRAAGRPLPRRSLADWGVALGVALAVLGWTQWRAHAALAERLPVGLEGPDLTVVGVVATMPIGSATSRAFAFDIERCEATGDAPEPCPSGRRVRLGWSSGFRGEAAAPLPRLRPGERWRFVVRLKRPHAMLNPGAFDAELRSLQEGIAAAGSVRGGRRHAAEARRLAEWVPGAGVAIERARDGLREALRAGLADADPAAADVIVALVVGDQAAIDSPWWETFNRTGVGHLMSISGLHITMLAGLAAAAARRACRTRRFGASRLARHASAQSLALAAGIATGFAYAAIAGWGIPAQRTCWMLAVAGLAHALGRSRAPLHVLSTAAFAVVLADPWAPMAAGFWLSFAAVAAILWAAACPPAGGSGFWREALRSQWAATVSLLPLGALFFGTVSWVGPLANAIAIPVVSALVTPAALAASALALVSPSWAAWPLEAIAWPTARLLQGLEWLGALPSAVGTLVRPQGAVLAAAVAGAALLLAPWPIAPRILGAVLLAPMVLQRPDAPAPGELWLTAFDVGQGTAVLVETAHGRLLYDTGPAWGEGSDAGARVLLPALRARGIGRLQALVVSHRDLDHAGGLGSVLRAMPIDWIASSLEEGDPLLQGAPRHHPCRRGARWRWGDVEFAFLHPPERDETAMRSPTNARSCVLRIEAAGGSVLLAGDIESAQERRLVSLFGAQGLRSDVLVAPHHGSATSSSSAFLEAVAPRWAIFQVGYRNRFRHPSAKVLPRYRDAGIGVLRSDVDGAITLRLAPGAAAPPLRLRRDAPPYWRVRVDAED